MRPVIFVAPAGNDLQGNGTWESPFATPARALEHAAGQPSVIELAGGEYFLQQPLELGRQHRDLVLRGAAGKTARLSGAMPLPKEGWTCQAPLWQCRLPANLKADGLFFNGERMTLCRYPNEILHQLPLGGTATASEVKKRAETYADPTGGFLRGMHEAGWGGCSYLISGKDPASPCGLSCRWVGDNNRGGKLSDQLVVKNVWEELDAPGEWFYDSKSGLLSFYPPDAAFSPAQADLRLAVTSELIRLVGANRISMENLTFSCTRRTLFSIDEPGKSYVPLLRGDWCVVRSGAVFIEACEACRISQCGFHDLGGNGIFFSGYNRGHLVWDNEFQRIGATAIQAAGLPEAVWEPSFWDQHRTGVNHPEKTGAKTEDYPRELEFSQNHIEDVGIFEKQSAGINLSVSSRIRILQNTIHHSARSLININDGTFGGHEIAFNDLFDSQRETQDHGPFNSWGRDRFWSVPRYNAAGEGGKQIRHGPDGIDLSALDACQITTIHHNRFHHAPNAPHTWGIDLDDGSSYYDIHHNLNLGLGIKLREGFSRYVHHNILVHGQLQIHVPYEEARDRIEYNLILHASPVGTAGVTKARWKRTRSILENNLFWSAGKPPRLPFSLRGEEHKNIRMEPLLDETFQIQNPVLLSMGFENPGQIHYGKTGCPCHAPAYALNQPAERPLKTKKARWCGASVCDLDEALRSSTAFSSTNGVYFLKVPRFSKAWRLGLRPRDVLFQADNNGVSGINALSAPHSITLLTVHRNNQTIRLRKKE